MRQAPWALIVWDTLKWTRHPTRWGHLGTALERTFHWSPPSRGWEKRLGARHSFPWQPRWASIWQRGAHSAPCYLHQIWWAIGQGEQQPLERLTSGLCNCWQGVALTPLASPHMDAKQLHSRCLRNMVQTRKTRLVLGHHQTKQGTSEVYARDVQSAPLRVLETMFRDIRLGHFCPDETRSGMMQRCDDTVTIQPTLLPLPAAEESAPEEPSMMPVITSEAIFGDVESEGASNELPIESLNEDAINEAPEEHDDSSSSSTSSSEDSLDEMVEELAQQPPDVAVQDIASAGKRQPSFYQHRSSKVVHMLSQGFGQSFLCGRQLSKEYRMCSLLLVVESMKCQQCVKRHKGRSRDIDNAQLDSAVKRARIEWQKDVWNSSCPRMRRACNSVQRTCVAKCSPVESCIKCDPCGTHISRLKKKLFHLNRLSCYRCAYSCAWCFHFHG